MANKALSDETLNSLADNEFPAPERARILQELQSDQESKERACQLHALKDMVKTAYQDIPPSRVQQAEKSFRHWWAMAASLLLAAVIGLVYELTPSANHQRMVLLDPEGRGQQLAQNTADELRIVFHISNSTRKHASELLDDIEGLLQQAQQNGKRVRVEVVAHAEGLDLLRERLSTQKSRIAEMSLKYPDLTFVACLNTIERLRVEKGIEVSLIPEARTTLSGVAYVVKRQREGWVYIQV